ncbi:hypothetical protein LTR56_017185 [Elasticomyces elasticus]|nr:hypothetical protein LTR56_017185 [Elasticomyces elasticus]KAK3666301.1 hypothetical protein LTR22_002965 [Elasticomyces elasticus]KAK4926897.1 hypothetical protein LTR49_006313 [Elasticomyces elasticus]KAK5752672.1 hypothetical protein LTS12_017241 [Elasticomyces elasticus]
MQWDLSSCRQGARRDEVELYLQDLAYHRRDDVSGRPDESLNDVAKQWLTLLHKSSYDPNATWGNWRTYDPSLQKLGNPLLFTSVEDRNHYLPPGGSELAQLTIGLFGFNSPDTGPANGTYVNTVCDYIPAILEYGLVIVGNQATIESSKTVEPTNNTLAYSNTLPREQVQPTTMGALTAYMGLFVTANASLYIHSNSLAGAEQWTIDPSGMSGNAATVGKYLDYTKTAYGIFFVDPTSDIISSLNELLFRGGVAATSWTYVFLQA